MSFICPKCGYVEYDWRPKTWDTTCGDWLCRLVELEQVNPGLAERVKKEKEVVIEPYAYKLSKTGIWVIRRWTQIWKVQGFKNIPAEKVKKPKDHFQQKLLKKEVSQ